MIKKIDYRQFFIVLFIYYTLQTIIKTLYGGVEFDDAEQFLLYQNGLQWIYPNAQPPLYNWIQYLSFELFGENIFALSVVKHTLLLFIFIFIYKLLLKLNTTKAEATVGTALLFLLPQVSWGCELKLSHSVLLLLMSVLTVYYIIKLIDSKSILNYFLLGIIIAFGILSKYSYLLLLVSIVLSLLLFKEFRKILLNKKVFITIFTTIILVLPHFIEVYMHWNSVFDSIYSKVHKTHTISYAFKSLLLAVLAFLGPLLLIIVWFFKSCKFNFRNNKFKLLTTIIIVNMLLVIVLVLLGVFDNFKERWFLPYLFLIPVILVGSVNYNCIKTRESKIFKTVYFFMLIVLVIFLVRLFSPNLIAKIKKGKYSHDAIDYGYLKKVIKGNNRVITCNNLALCGNIKLIFNDSKVILGTNSNSSIFVSDKYFKDSKEIFLPCKYGSKECLKVYIKGD